MKLYLVRHGESLSSDMDPNQPLSERGWQETESVAASLKEKKIEIDEIMHSVKLRAQQTAQILGNALAPQLPLIEKQGLKPMDPVEPILEEILSYDCNVMIVGHLPFLEKLLSILLFHEEGSSPIAFVGSCAVCLEKKEEKWTILWVASPLL